MSPLARASAMISLHRSMHSRQIATPGTAINMSTCGCALPQKLHFRSLPSIGDFRSSLSGITTSVRAARSNRVRRNDRARTLGGDQIHCVQLNDGPLRLPGGVPLEENCFDRGWPGTGEFPLIEIVRTLAGLDALRQVSPEVFSPHNATRSAAEIAALSSGSLHALLDAADVAY